jgi:hypothetical protein
MTTRQKTENLIFQNIYSAIQLPIQQPTNKIPPLPAKKQPIANKALIWHKNCVSRIMRYARISEFFSKKFLIYSP